MMKNLRLIAALLLFSFTTLVTARFRLLEELGLLSFRPGDIENNHKFTIVQQVGPSPALVCL
jgi:hypothetical protein